MRLTFPILAAAIAFGCARSDPLPLASVETAEVLVSSLCSLPQLLKDKMTDMVDERPAASE